MEAGMSFRKHILYVDDSRDTSVPANIALQPCCYNVVRASLPTEVLRLAENSYFDLYLINPSLCQGVALELCKKIRALDAYTPIVFCASVANESFRKAATQAGARGYIVAPVEPWEIEETLLHFMREAESRKQDLIRASRCITEPRPKAVSRSAAA